MKFDKKWRQRPQNVLQTMEYQLTQLAPNHIFMSKFSQVIETNVMFGLVYWCKSPFKCPKPIHRENIHKNQAKLPETLIFFKSTLN